MVRTSVTHPLRVDELRVGNGRLGVTFCPGKKGDSVHGEAWNRDLDLDMDAIKSWGARAVLTLIETSEFEMLSVTGLGKAVGDRDIDWHWFPVRDLDVPPPETMERWRALSPKLHRILERGGRVLVHCRGGLGRAGTMAALLLIERGRSAREAMERVRAARPGAIETRAQERWLERHAHQFGTPASLLHASLIGGAVGDSLGAEIEFLPLREIRHRFPDRIPDLPPHQGLRGAITDDTQMTLFTAEGIIRARARAGAGETGHLPSEVHLALLRWFRNQGGTPRVAIDETGLVSDHRLCARRAPGMTCLSALERCERPAEPARNDSKGCGTIMRVAPVALMVPRDQVRSIAMETSALTHGHPTGQLAAAAWAEMLADVATGADLEDRADEIAADYAAMAGGEETARAIRSALAAPRTGDAETVEALGGGWTAEEALSIALYSCLSGTTFEEVLQIAVRHGGDSDSTGAIAGNMAGLIHPADALSHGWSEAVECADIIARLVDDHLRVQGGMARAERKGPAAPGV